MTYRFGPIEVEVMLIEEHVANLNEFEAYVGTKDVSPQTMMVVLSRSASDRDVAKHAIRDLIYAYRDPSDYIRRFTKFERVGGRKRAIEIARFAATLGESLMKAWPFISPVQPPKGGPGPKEWMPGL